MKPSELNRLATLRTKVSALNSQINAIEEEQSLELMNSLIGRCFTADNSFRGSRDGKKEKLWKWLVYLKITGIKDGCLVGFQFQIYPTDGVVRIEPETYVAEHSFGGSGSMWKPLLPTSFDRAWYAAQERICAMKP